MRIFFVFACVLALASGTPVATRGGGANPRSLLRRAMADEDLVYDKIKDILSLEIMLETLTLNPYSKYVENSLASQGRVPLKKDMRRYAIGEYTVDSKDYQNAVLDEKFDAFYSSLAVANARTAADGIRFPNAQKTIGELQAIYNALFDEFVFDGDQLRKKESFSFPSALKEKTTRVQLYEGLEKDVKFLRAAFFQSFLMSQERIEKNKDQTLYRLQGHSPEINQNYKAGYTFCTNRFTSTSRPEGGKTFLTADETEHQENSPAFLNANKVKIEILKRSGVACGAYLGQKLRDGGKEIEGNTIWHSKYQREVTLPVGTCLKINKIIKRRVSDTTGMDIGDRFMDLNDEQHFYQVIMECVPNYKG